MKGNKYFIAEWQTPQVHFVNNLSGLTTGTSQVAQPARFVFQKNIFIPLFSTFWKTLPARNRCVVEPSAYVEKHADAGEFQGREGAAGGRALRDLSGFTALCNNSYLSKYFVKGTDPTHFWDARSLLARHAHECWNHAWRMNLTERYFQTFKIAALEFFK